MAIEFRCPGCNRRLRVGEAVAGKRAKCPECGTVLIVPSASAAAPATAPAAAPAPAPQPRPAPGGLPPAAAPPPQPGPPAGQAPAAGGEIRPTRIALGEVYSRTWAILKSQFGTCLVAMLAVVGIVFEANIAVFIVNIVLAVARLPSTMRTLVMFPLNLGCGVLGFWLQIGQGLFFLKIARGERADLADLFTGGPYFGRILGAGILFLLMYFVGLVLFVIPGIIVALMFSQFYLLILDRNVGVIESLELSKDVTEGNKLTLFLINLVAVVLMFVAMIPCGLGLIVAVPFFALLMPVTYLMMTGQPTAAERLATPPRPKPAASGMPPAAPPDWL